MVPCPGTARLATSILWMRSNRVLARHFAFGIPVSSYGIKMAYILFAVHDRQHLESISDVARLFADLGHQVEVVSDGNEAFDYIKTDIPNVLVADVSLPNKDGFELALDFHQLNPTKRIGVILLTPITADLKGQVRTQQQCRPWIDLFLVKPYRSSDCETGDEDFTYRHQMAVSLEDLLHRLGE